MIDIKLFKFSNKAQASTELLIILSIGLAILLIIFSINTNTSQFARAQFETSKARSTIDDLANAAELVYRQGVGSKTKLYVNMPRSTNFINISNQTILFNIQAGGDAKDVYRNLDFTITNGSISTTSGNRIFYVESGRDFVFITDNSSQLAELCANNYQDGTEDCDNLDFNGESCITQGYDEGNLSCTSLCQFNLTECAGPGTVPDSITNLAFASSDAYSIKWTWTNPSTPDFKENIVYVNNSNLANTSNAFYTATGLTPLTQYTIIVHTNDYGGNINDTDVINIANSTSNNTTGNTSSFIYLDSIPVQFCNAQDNEAKGTLDETCDGTYPGFCDGSNDLISCNDAQSETHTANKQGATRNYAGINITVYNTSTTDCSALDTVLLCYEWWASDSVQDCDISIDADGGTSYTAVTTTCPGTTTNPGLTCTNITGLETWTCNSFFDTTGTRAIAKSEAQHASTGQKTVTWDALYFNVTYTVET